jgi:hypothetical protein
MVYVLPRQEVVLVLLLTQGLQGITTCANVLVQALIALFPDSIDRLEPETSLIGGPKPIWVSTRGTNAFTLFTSKNSQCGGDGIEFGAHHCA